MVEGAPEKPAEPKGPPDRSAEYFSDIAHRNSRREAVKEYRRTLDEFRQTGAIQEKEWADFAHLTNPPDIQLHVFDAHQRAALDIEHWQDEQAEAEQESAREELRAQLLGEKARREEATRSPEIATQDSRAEISQSPVAPPPTPTPTAPLPQGGLLRGVPFNPHAPGRNARWEPAIPQLELAPVPERLPASEDQTEALLNAIIGECHFYMREVTFPSLCHAGNADDRMGWIGKAVQLAETGATVAKAVARLRHGPGVKETRHTTTIVQNRLDTGQGGGG